MTNEDLFADAVNREIDWHKVLSHHEWFTMPEIWQNWDQQNPTEKIKNGEDVLLFRTHKFHTNPDLRTKESDGIIHASCRPIIPNPSAIKRYDARAVYGGDERFTFMSLYKAHFNQIFHEDEGLEHGSHGVAITEIEKFDRHKHFETNARDCETLGIYMVQLPEDTSKPMKPKPVLDNGIKVLRIDDKPQILSALGQKLAAQFPDFSPHLQEHTNE